MVFPTLTFAVFFAAVYVIHLAIRPHRVLWQWFMVAASFVFYAWYVPVFAGVLAGAIAVAHLGARSARRSPWAVRLSVIGIVAVLVWTKYATWLFGTDLGWHWAAPIGMAFLTIQAIGYVVDARRGVVEIGPLRETALFLAFFPQLVCGPVLRAKPFLTQMRGQWPPQPVPVGRAAGFIAAGAVKKIVVVGVISEAFAPVAAAPSSFGGPDVVAWLFADFVRLWADVSSYADFAIGIGLLLGVDLPANFKQPLAARSYMELWQRWQVTVYQWMRSYVFTPLAGERRTPVRTVFAVFATFLVSGIWHGAGFGYVILGLLCGVAMSASAGRRVWYQRRKRVAPRPVGIRAVVATVWIWLYSLPAMQLLLGAGPGELAEIARAAWSGWTTAPTTLTPFVTLVVAAAVASHFVPARWRTATRQHLDSLHPVAVGSALAVLLTAAAALGTRGVAPYLYYGF